MGNAQIDPSTGSHGIVAADGETPSEVVAKGLVSSFGRTQEQEQRRKNKQLEQMENEEDRSIGQIQALEHQELQGAERDLAQSKMARLKSEDDLRKEEERDRHDEVLESRRLDRLQKEDEDKLDKLTDDEAQLEAVEAGLSDQELIQRQKLKNEETHGKEEELMLAHHSQTVIGNAEAAMKEQAAAKSAKLLPYRQESAEERAERCATTTEDSVPAESEEKKRQENINEDEAADVNQLIHPDCIPVVNEKSVNDILKASLEGKDPLKVPDPLSSPIPSVTAVTAGG